MGGPPGILDYAGPCGRRGIVVRQSATVIRIDLPPQDAATIRHRQVNARRPATLGWRLVRLLGPVGYAAAADRRLAVIRVSRRRLTFACIYVNGGVGGWSVPRADVISLSAEPPGLAYRCRPPAWLPSAPPPAARLLSDLPAEVTAWMADQLAPYMAQPTADCQVLPIVFEPRPRRHGAIGPTLSIGRRRGVPHPGYDLHRLTARMDDTATILDYAGPRKRSRLRMASQSDLSLSVTADRVVVAESLAGRGSAVAGIAFGLAVMGVMAVTVAMSAYDVRRGRLHNNALNIPIPMAVLVAAMAGLMLAIVQQTWRRTTLTAAHDDLRLSFTSPLHRRHYRWTGNDIADVVIALTANDGTAAPLGEVLITRVSGGDVRLFTDHLAERLGPIARSVHDALRHGRADVPAVSVVAAEPMPVPDDLLPRAERTAGRLVDLHRSRRDKP